MRRSIDAADVTAEDIAKARENVRPSLDPVQVGVVAGLRGRPRLALIGKERGGVRMKPRPTIIVVAPAAACGHPARPSCWWQRFPARRTSPASTSTLLTLRKTEFDHGSDTVDGVGQDFDPLTQTSAPPAWNNGLPAPSAPLRRQRPQIARWIIGGLGHGGNPAGEEVHRQVFAAGCGDPSIQGHDAFRHRAQPLVTDRRPGLSGHSPRRRTGRGRRATIAAPGCAPYRRKHLITTRAELGGQ